MAHGMGRVLGALAVLAIVVGLGSVRPGEAATSSAAVKYKNPLFSRPFPDPMVLRVSAHNYYAYGTSMPWEKKHHLFPILHSKDMVHWKVVGDVFPKALSWAAGDYWAPDVVKHGKTYYVYYTASFITIHCVGVATGKSPTGPFKDHGRIGCSDDNVRGYIDPDLFIDKDGKAYLYFSVDDPQHNISVFPMKSDLIHPAGDRKEVLGVTQDWEKGKNRSTVEGPYVIRQGDTYYLFFSGNDWEDNYSMGYATSSSPTGPFTAYSGNPIMKGDSKVFGPGGGSIVKGPDGKLWMVYHAWPTASKRSTDQRSLRVDPLVWNGSSFSVKVTPK